MNATTAPAPLATWQLQVRSIHAAWAADQYNGRHVVEPTTILEPRDGHTWEFGRTLPAASSRAVRTLAVPGCGGRRRQGRRKATPAVVTPETTPGLRLNAYGAHALIHPNR